MFHHHKKHHDHHHKHGDISETERLESTSTSTSTTSHLQGQTGAVVEKHMNAAALAEEKIHHKENVHVTPVVTRDVEQTEVRQIKQPVHETQVLPTQHHEQVLPQQNIEKNMATPIPAQQLPVPKRVETGKEVHTQQHAPVVQERVHHKVIEDVQPVVYRDVVQEHHVNVKQPIHEHIVQPAVVTQSTAPMIEKGVTNLTSGTGLSSGTHTGTMHSVDRMHHTGTSTMAAAPMASTTTHHTTYTTHTASSIGTGVGPSMASNTGGGVIHQKFQGQSIPSAQLVGQTGAGTGMGAATGNHPILPETELAGGKRDAKRLEKRVGDLNINDPTYAGQAK